VPKEGNNNCSRKNMGTEVRLESQFNGMRSLKVVILRIIIDEPHKNLINLKIPHRWSMEEHIFYFAANRMRRHKPSSTYTRSTKPTKVVKTLPSEQASAQNVLVAPSRWLCLNITIK
jgi:hypothetical protein